MAAAMYRFDVPPADVAPVAGKPGPFAPVSARDGTPGIYLPAGGVLSYFMELPENARLVVSAGASQPERFLAPAGATLRVTVRPDEGEAYEDFREATSPGGEILTLEMELGSLAGRRAEIAFGAEGHDVFLRPLFFAADRSADR
ncbi:MAG: hypothetical protein GY953_44520, partial [bacterium]|nr:hypothetical protein [bacterium]